VDLGGAGRTNSTSNTINGILSGALIARQMEQWHQDVG